MTRKSQLDYVTLHEAGHAVLFVIAKIPIKSVEILVTEIRKKPHYGGGVWKLSSYHKHKCNDEYENVSYKFFECICYAAGMATEIQFGCGDFRDNGYDNDKTFVASYTDDVCKPMHIVRDAYEKFPKMVDAVLEVGYKLICEGIISERMVKNCIKKHLTKDEQSEIREYLLSRFFS